ncbi:MAG TPA: cation:proton antiporter [Candidatus Corynebacterium avicola]|uniref:Cation:proton antiporter n=1 Tax=Candidatus Corynebacterium avicola TaxID=2838527 RepID=A0A9D1RR37_9CORY|nr:cation:proton antiporter [Candidatus Corynebacterium avicola]
MTTLFVIICLMPATVLTVGVGDRIGLPWPVLLLLVTTAVMFVPGTPTIEVDSELILPLFLPPLLWALARRTSWGMFRDQWRTILSLSVGLVFVTVAVVTGVAVWLIPGVGLVSALALAAAVAPPDPVAVEAVAEPAGIPRRIIGSLQSEGLFNDAASLVIFSAAITAAEFHDDIHWFEAGGTFVYSAIGAMILGWVLGRISSVVLGWLDSPVAGNAFTWVLPFLAYLGAEEIHVSGVIAVVVAAVELTSRTDATAADARLTGAAFWEVTELLITGLAFGLMGMNVRDAIIDDEVEHLSPVGWGLLISVVLVAVRFLWMTTLLRSNRTKRGRYRAPVRFTDVILLTWSGMRGLVTFALVLSLNPVDFPMRAEFTIVAFVVLLCTMVIPGLTLPALTAYLRRTRDLQDLDDKLTEQALDEAYQVSVSVVERRIGDGLTPEQAARITERLGVVRSVSPLDDSSDDDVEEISGESKKIDPEEARRRRERAKQAAHRVVEIRRESLHAAQRSLAAARYRKGVDPEAISEKLHEIDRRLLSLPKDHHE